MLQNTTLIFLQNIKKNNNKVWLDANKTVYDSAKADFENFTALLLKELGKLDAELLDLAPKNCTFRLNRDVRFSKNKDPYKSNFGASIKKGGKKSDYCGYYLHLEPGNIFAGGGYYMPEAPILNKLRQEIDYNWAAWSKIVNSKKFMDCFGKNWNNEGALKNIPKGYTIDNPAAEFLKLKSYAIGATITDKDICNKDAVKKVIDVFKTLKPVIDFLNASI